MAIRTEDACLKGGSGLYFICMHEVPGGTFIFFVS
jgi:hypothetical protein